MTRAPRQRHPPSGSAETLELAVGEIGAQGDGVARHGGGPVYIPFTVPGDRILARLDRGRGAGRAATIERLLAPGPGRAEPPCRHFGRCGGCALQHLSPALYAETKLGLVRAALARHGLGDAPVEPIRLLPPGTRRRVRFTLGRSAAGGAARIGLAERASHAIVDLAECPVIDDALFALVAPLRRLAAAILAPGESGHAMLQRPGSGIDLLLDLPRAPDLAGLERLAEFAEAQDLARLSWREAAQAPVPLAQRRPVQLVLGGVAVDLPVAGFLQATPEAEAALSQAVRRAVGGESGRLADLFAGIGTFTFALAGAGRRIHAVEGWAPAVAALEQAARRAGLGDRVSAETRDLAVRPLPAAELAAYDAVLFDPPRIGAKAQAAALAESAVPRIAAISCHPASFARDARRLIAGGYRLLWVQPIDQFVWSPHIELVAAFAR